MSNKSMADYLEMDGGIIMKISIYNYFSSIGDGCYSEICGGFIEGVYQWADHNVLTWDECSNDKYTGWTITFNCGTTRRFYIGNWVMNIQPANFKHARNLFSKYLKADHKYNNAQIASNN